MSDQPLTALAELNPRVRSTRALDASEMVSFIAMNDVSVSGQWVNRQVRRLGDVSLGFTSFEEGDVLVAKITPCLENGKGAHALGLEGGIGFGSTEFHVLRAKPGVNPRYLHHLCLWRQLRVSAESQMVGSAGQQRVPRQFFSDFTVARLAEPEQRRIAEVLDTLDTAIHETEAIIAKLKAVKQGLLHDLLTRGIDANGELRPPQAEAPHLYKLSALGWIPADWDSLILGDTLEHVIDFRGRTPKKLGMDWGGGNILALSANNVQPGAIDISREAHFGGDLLYRKWMTNGDVHKGDVLLTMEAPLGNVAQVPDEARYIMSQRVIALRFNAGAVLNDFAFWQMQGTDFQQAMIRRSSGSTATGIQRAELVRLQLKAPPLREQSLIAERLFSVEHRLICEGISLRKRLQQKSGFMDDLLTGRVRVTPLLDATSP
jgi:type I restriction enzyme S subunit